MRRMSENLARIKYSSNAIDMIDYLARMVVKEKLEIHLSIVFQVAVQATLASHKFVVQ